MKSVLETVLVSRTLLFFFFHCYKQKCVKEDAPCPLPPGSPPVPIALVFGLYQQEVLRK